MPANIVREGLQCRLGVEWNLLEGGRDPPGGIVKIHLDGLKRARLVLPGGVGMYVVAALA